MSASYFVASTSGKLFSSEDLAPGEIAYLAGQTQPVLCMAIGTGERGWLELGGERSLTIWNAQHDVAAAWTIPDWRLEVDLTSLIDAQHAGLRKGFAFRHGERSGLIGFYNRVGGFGVCLPVGTDGASVTLTAGEHKAFFSRWRIVVDTSDGIRILVDDEGMVQPN